MSSVFFVYVEVRKQELFEGSLEALCEARRLADAGGGQVAAVVMGHGVAEAAQKIGAYGADAIHCADHPSLAAYAPELYAGLVVSLMDKHRPFALFFGSSPLAADLASRVAAETRACFLPEVDRLAIAETGGLSATRLCYEGKIHTTVRFPESQLGIATIQGGVIKVKKAARSADPACFGVEAGESLLAGKNRIQVLRFIKADPKSMDIKDAPLIVAGGKGAGGKESFAEIEHLADLLGAAVAGSRMAVDMGAITRERQIGQSGKSVSSELLISCGISGANAHVIGLKDVKTLVAVNKDKNAPIMKLADLGVVGDLNEVIPALNRLLKDHAQKTALKLKSEK